MASILTNQSTLSLIMGTVNCKFVIEVKIANINMRNY